MLSPESLVQFGFREWPTCPSDRHDRQWQYCVADQRGKKFYVQVYLWQFSKYSTPDHPVADSWSANVQFNTFADDKRDVFDVDLHVRDKSPEDIVAWFDDLFVKLECEYYEQWSDDAVLCDQGT
jgi:hypothetical protein